MFRIVRVNSLEFAEELKSLNQIHAFNNPHFAMLNNLWVDEIHFLLIKSSRTVLAITLGERNGELLSPWSATFGGFSFLRDSISVHDIDISLGLLLDYARRCNCSQLSLSLTPLFYSQSFLTKLSFCCSRLCVDRICNINYFFDLTDVNIGDSLNRNYRRNLKKGINNQLTLIRCESLALKEKCYSVIEDNRSSLGYSFKIGFQPLLNNAEIFDVDFFILQNKTEIFAAAICYWMTPEIVKIAYWGDYTLMRGEGAMVQLSAQLQEYYFKLNVKFLDVGQSSIQGVPNVGLCNFLEQIGCSIDSQNNFKLIL